MNDELTDKDKSIIKEILTLEKINNKIQRFTTPEIVSKIIDIIKKGVNDEV